MTLPHDYMLLEDLHDRCADDEHEATPEEIGETQRLVEEWAALEASWQAAGEKCRCGQPITLQDAFDFGCCAACRKDEPAF